MGVGGVIGALAPDSPRSLDPPCAADEGLPAGLPAIRSAFGCQYNTPLLISYHFVSLQMFGRFSHPSMQPSIVFGLPSLHYDPDSLGCSRISGPAFIAELSWVQASLSRLTLGCPSPTLRLVAPRGHRSKRNGDIAFSLLSEAALCPARWRASSCRPKLGGALRAKTSQLTPAGRRLDHVRAQRHAGPSVDGAGRASTVPVAALACAVRQGRARAPPPAAPT
jgi:hypothetical protein